MPNVETLLALATFAFVTSVTPGPNNVMLLASGLNFGFLKTIPHMLGISIGFAAMVLVVGLGFGQILAAAPFLETVIKVAGIAYMLWLAWNLAIAGGIGEGAGKSRPMTFLEAAAFQWVNPKAWAIIVSATATFGAADAFVTSVVVIALVFVAVNLPSVSTWALFGAWMRRYLRDGPVVRVFNGVMAALLVASLWPAVAGLVWR